MSNGREGYVGRAPHRVGLRALLVLLVCVAGVLTGCTVGPSVRPPVAVRGENIPAPPTAAATPAPDTLPVPQPQNSSITFFDCTQGILAALPTPPPADRTLRVECGDIIVPTDPNRPDRDEVAIGVLRVGLADAPSNRPPLLMLGDSAGQPSALHAAVLAGQVSPGLLQRFTLIGLDRRGSGLDDLDCSPITARSALLDADPAATAERELLFLLERARSIVQECNITVDRDLSNYRTSATAADVGMLREALGVDRLSAVGVGDGAVALAGWARAAPGTVGRLVLDGPTQPGLDEPELGESRAAAAEATFEAFAVACTARPDCLLGADPRAAVTGLLDTLRVRPLAAVDGRRLTAGSATNALLTGLGEPRTWPALEAALAAAGAGDPAPLLGVLDPVIGPRGHFDSMLATACNDNRRRLSPGEIGELAARWRTEYPLFGGTQALHMIACAPWPTGGTAPDAGNAPGAPPILVVGTAADPRAALDGSRRAADSLESGRFLSWQGAGTGAYPRTACVTGVVDAMLLDGVAPQPGTLCPP